MDMKRNDMIRFTEANYKAASAWYKAKYDVLDRKIRQDSQKSASELAEDIEDKFLAEWQKQISKQPLGGDIEQITSNTQDYTKEYEFPVLEKKKGHINYLTAENFEKAFKEYLSEWFSQTISPEIKSYGVEWTGKVLQEGLTFARGKQKMIRSDVALFDPNIWKVSEQEIKKPVEFLTEIDYSSIKERLNSLTATEEYVQQVIQFLKDNVTGYDDFYGFSLKNYTHGVEYTSSVVLYNQLKKDITTMEPQDKVYYMEYFLSKYIIPIASPSVIALVQQNRFLWMHDVLNSYIFRFSVEKKSGDPAGTEIYLRQRARSLTYKALKNNNKSKNKVGITITSRKT